MLGARLALTPGALEAPRSVALSAWDQAGSTSPARYARGRQESMQWLLEKDMTRQGCARIGVFGRQRAPV